MRVPFHQVFNINPNGSMSTRMTVRIGMATMSPGVSFSAGAIISGVNLFAIQGKDLEVEK
jgi:hypothetical protein